MHFSEKKTLAIRTFTLFQRSTRLLDTCFVYCASRAWPLGKLYNTGTVIESIYSKNNSPVRKNYLTLFLLHFCEKLFQ